MEYTGLNRQENWGLDSEEQQWNQGLARIVDGLFRNIFKDHSWQQQISEEERANIHRRFGCNMLEVPREVTSAVLGNNAPSEADLTQACMGRISS